MSDLSIVEVTQVDRDEAADYAQATGQWILDWDAIRRGDLDDTVFVKAFADKRFAAAIRSLPIGGE